MKFGDYECLSIDMGEFRLDGGAMFGVVPKALWEKKIPADDKNRIPMKARSLLIKGNGKNILVDTGCGIKVDEKMKAIYHIGDAPKDMGAPQVEAFLTSLAVKLNMAAGYGDVYMPYALERKYPKQINNGVYVFMYQGR